LTELQSRVEYTTIFDFFWQNTPLCVTYLSSRGANYAASANATKSPKPLSASHISSTFSRAEFNRVNASSRTSGGES
jgi:hypothetical protein